MPLATGWSLAVVTDVGDDPRADNPGALTLAELGANRDSVPALNANRHAGKDVTQYQTGATVRRTMGNGGEAAFTVFGVGRNLKNPITTAYIDLGFLRLRPTPKTVNAAISRTRSRRPTSISIASTTAPAPVSATRRLWAR